MLDLLSQTCKSLEHRLYKTKLTIIVLMLLLRNLQLSLVHHQSSPNTSNQHGINLYNPTQHASAQSAQPQQTNHLGPSNTSTATQQPLYQQYPDLGEIQILHQHLRAQENNFENQKQSLERDLAQKDAHNEVVLRRYHDQQILYNESKEGLHNFREENQKRFIIKEEQGAELEQLCIELEDAKMELDDRRTSTKSKKSRLPSRDIRTK